MSPYVQLSGTLCPVDEEFEEWRAGRDGGFSEWLRAVAGPVWDAAVTHRFTDELFRGAVPDEVMRAYLVQDYQFVDRFLALLGAAVASAGHYSSRVVLARQLGLVAGEENTYFQRAFDALDVPEADRRDPVLNEVTRAFNAMLEEAARSAMYPYCLTVLTVAEWLYLDWASRAPRDLPESFVYREWVTLHDNPEFRVWVRWLRDELDRVGAGLDRATQQRCRGLFVAATELELKFFDAAYD